MAVTCSAAGNPGCWPALSTVTGRAWLAEHPQVRYVDLLLPDQMGIPRGKRVTVHAKRVDGHILVAQKVVRG